MTSPGSLPARLLAAPLLGLALLLGATAASAQEGGAPTPEPAPTATATPAPILPPPAAPSAPAPGATPAPAAPATPAAAAPPPSVAAPHGGQVQRRRRQATRAHDGTPAPEPRKHKPAKPKPEPPAAAPDGAAGGGGAGGLLGAAGAGAPLGVPNFFIDRFRIPPFLLPIYQAAGTEYGVRWEVLAAINEIETDYGRNLNVSSAGAQGWMQFMPATWKEYGVDANRDGVRDPYNPVDAIFAAARYLRAAGADKDVRRGIFAYNHADWYVDSVMLRARVIGGLPAGLVGSLTGLTQGRFPVLGRAHYAGQVSRRAVRRVRGGNAARPVESSARRHGITIDARAGSRVVAVNDGRVLALGRSRRLGRFLRLQDAYGNEFTYAHLGTLAERVPAPRPRARRRIRHADALPAATRRPTRPASETRRRAIRHASRPARGSRPAPAPRARGAKARLFAHPARPRARAAGGRVQLGAAGRAPALALGSGDTRAVALRRGTQVIGGSVLGRLARPGEGRRASLRFEIRPVGDGAPRIDPKPILDGWELLEATAIYRAGARNPLTSRHGRALTIGQILLMGKVQLQRHLLRNRRIHVYPCGRRDIRLGLVDRRVLATLETLAASGLEPTVSALRCGHGYLTSSGNVSEHSSGNAVDIAAINGIPIAGHQGRGSITEQAIRRLLTLQGPMEPHQIISLMTFAGHANTLNLPDHADHIHVGFHPLYRPGSTAARRVDADLEPEQWIGLVDRLSRIENPVLRSGPPAGR